MVLVRVGGKTSSRAQAVFSLKQMRAFMFAVPIIVPRMCLQMSLSALSAMQGFRKAALVNGTVAVSKEVSHFLDLQGQSVAEPKPMHVVNARELWRPLRNGDGTKRG